MFNLFGKKKTEEKKKKPVNIVKDLLNADLETIWRIEDKNHFLIAMDGWLSRKCQFGEDIEKLSDAEKVIYFNGQLEAEVNNGGFSQYFYNSSGNFANRTVDSLTAVGAAQVAEILKKALQAVGVNLPENWSERQELLNQVLTEDIEAKLNEFDSEFYLYPDNLEELNYGYIIANKSQFTETAESSS